MADQLLKYSGTPGATVTYSTDNPDGTEHTAETGGVSALHGGLLRTLYGVLVADPPIGGTVNWYEGGQWMASATITRDAPTADAIKTALEAEGSHLALIKTAAESADGKLTAGRLAKIDGAAQETAATANKAEIVAAIPNAARPGYMRITQATLDTAAVAIGVVAPGAVVTAYLKPDETTTVGPSEPATSVGAWYLDLPPDGLWRVRATGADYDHTDVEVQT